MMDFSDALRFLKLGRRMQRAGWSGTGQYVRLLEDWRTGDMEPQLVGAMFVLRNTQGVLVSWVPSIEDLLAQDWQIAR